MRALSGAIITAAALIGLGLTAQGIGTRYTSFIREKPLEDENQSRTHSLAREVDFAKSHVKISDLDGAMKVCLTVLVLSALIGIGITFVGLMYHHHRRFHEHLRVHGQPPAHSVSTHLPS